MRAVMVIKWVNETVKLALQNSNFIGVVGVGRGRFIWQLCLDLAMGHQASSLRPEVSFRSLRCQTALSLSYSILPLLKRSRLCEGEAGLNRDCASSDLPGIWEKPRLGSPVTDGILSPIS